MKILITGGAGFIGSHLVDEYINKGYEVVVIDNLSTGKLDNINPKAKFYKTDIRDKDIEKIFAEERPDIVNHHAAQIDVRKSVADPISDAQINIIGSLNLLQCSVKYNVKRFLFASSGGVVYGEPRYLPADINHPLDPISPYGASKLSIEYYLNIFNHLYGLSYAAMRYGNVYGPRQDPHGEAGVVAIFSKKIIKNEPIDIFGNGKQLRDYVYIGDIVDANNILTMSDKSVGIYNIGTQIGSSVNDLWKIFCKITEKNIEKNYLPPRKGEIDHLYLKHDGDKFGWAPKVSLEDGLKRTYNYFLKERTDI